MLFMYNDNINIAQHSIILPQVARQLHYSMNILFLSVLYYTSDVIVLVLSNYRPV